LKRRSSAEDAKLSALRDHRALNPKPNTVHDPAFVSGNSFFDARDLVQVKYEMLRRVRQEGQPATQAAASFGLSRPSFYVAQQQFEREGLPGLVRERPGPRRAHKLSEEVVDSIEQSLAAEPTPRLAQLVELVRERFGLTVHVRSIERALERRRKKGPERQSRQRRRRRDDGHDL
jgi:transposase